MLAKNVQLTQEQFLRLMHLIAKDDVAALRRACQRGKEQLVSQGWQPRPKHDDDGGPAASPAPSDASPPMHVPTASRATRGIDLLAMRSDAGIRKGALKTGAKVRAQQLATNKSEELDECHSRIAHLSL